MAPGDQGRSAPRTAAGRDPRANAGRTATPRRLRGREWAGTGVAWHPPPREDRGGHNHRPTRQSQRDSVRGAPRRRDADETVAPARLLAGGSADSSARDPYRVCCLSAGRGTGMAVVPLTRRWCRLAGLLSIKALPMDLVDVIIWMDGRPAWQRHMLIGALIVVLARGAWIALPILAVILVIAKGPRGRPARNDLPNFWPLRSCCRWGHHLGRVVRPEAQPPHSVAGSTADDLVARRLQVVFLLLTLRLTGDGDVLQSLAPRDSTGTVPGG